MAPEMLMATREGSSYDGEFLQGHASSRPTHTLADEPKFALSLIWDKSLDHMQPQHKLEGLVCGWPAFPQQGSRSA